MTTCCRSISLGNYFLKHVMLMLWNNLLIKLFFDSREIYAIQFAVNIFAYALRISLEVSQVFNDSKPNKWLKFLQPQTINTWSTKQNFWQQNVAASYLTCDDNLDNNLWQSQTRLSFFTAYCSLICADKWTQPVDRFHPKPCVMLRSHNAMSTANEAQEEIFHCYMNWRSILKTI